MSRSPQTSEQRQKRREQILKAALTEFSKKGYHLTEVATIAKRASVAKGTVYNYFENKEDILLGIVQSGFDELSETMNKVAREDCDPITKIKKASFEYLSFFDKNKAFHQVLLKEAIHILPSARKVYCKYVEDHIDRLERLVRQGVRSGSFRKVDAKLAALSLIELVSAVLKGTVFINRPMDVKKDHKTIMKIYFEGLLKQ